jgi:hypothetical protein
MLICSHYRAAHDTFARLRGIFRQLKGDSRRLMPAGSGKFMFLLLFWRAPAEGRRRRRIVTRAEATLQRPLKLPREVYSADAIRTPGTPHMVEMARPGHAPTATVLHLPSF